MKINTFSARLKLQNPPYAGEHYTTRCLQNDFKVHFTARTWDLVCSMQNFMLYLMV